ncbi:MAG: DUF4105 domain-containing protein [Gammaproteobacteria bacterium]
MTPPFSRSLIFCFLLLCASVEANSVSGSPYVYANELIAKAHARHLDTDAYWYSLGHYKQSGLFKKTLVSQADDPAFFNDPQGKISPRHELDATLRAFFSKKKGDDHPQCRFPARYHWLKEALGFDILRLPEQRCGELEEWKQTINASQLTLIFPAAYMNGPSSMFGHTLLRITPSDHRNNAPLAAYALNYAADSSASDGGLSYVYKGLFGGYPGRFSIVPYYEKIKQYSDLENRDIWEYPLKLEQSEINQLLRHAWEVRKVQFDYYFLTENCSYHVLSLLETARPGLQLTDGFSVKAIPSDTVRKVVDAGLTGRPAYRVSTTSKIDQRLGLLGDVSLDLVYGLATGSQSREAIISYPEKEQSRLLELSYDYARYRALQVASKRDARASDNYQLLVARSKLPAGDVWPDLIRPDVQPEEGHETTRFSTGAGSLDDDAYLSFRFRPAYHDILDPLPGYSPGSQINFLDFRGRYFLKDRHFRLDRLTLIDILSLTPRTRFFKPISWGVDTGFERMHTGQGETNGLQINGGSGVSYRLFDKHLAYFLVKGQLKIARRFEDNFTLGTGGHAGLLFFFKHSSADLSVSSLRFSLGETDTFYAAKWRQSFPLGHQRAIRYTLESRQERGDKYNQFEVMFHWYFE